MDNEDWITPFPQRLFLPKALHNGFPEAGNHMILGFLTKKAQGTREKSSQPQYACKLQCFELSDSNT